MHGSQVPDYSRLSSTVLKNKLWASQNIAVAKTGESRTKAGATASLFAPIDADTLRARFKLAAETGPNILHAKISATCLDAASHCMQDYLAAKITTQHGTEKTFTLDASAKTRYTHENSGRDKGKNYCKFVDEDNFITREQIRHHAEILPPYVLGCDCKLMPRHPWETQSMANWKAVIPTHGNSYDVPDWRQLA